MNKKIFVVFILISLLSGFSVSACTGFTATENNITLVGNNEDWYNPLAPFISVYPPDKENYGRIFFKLIAPVDYYYLAPFGGMNDQGLFYDDFITPYLEIQNSINKPFYPGNIYEYCLAKCATVDEVIQVFNQYNLYYFHSTQSLWVDRTGASVIIEGDEIIYKEGDFQVVTSFLHSHPELGYYPCWRYNKAFSLLENMTELSVDYFKMICDEVHLQSHYWTTLYSNICDLNHGIIYLYHFHDFENCVQINLSEEFKKGPHMYFLPSLFEPIGNNPSDKPNKLVGPTSIRIRNEYSYDCNPANDPDGDKIYYFFDWGDETNTGWFTTQRQDKITASHTWNENGNYEIKVKTSDIYGAESEWSDSLVVSMPKNKGMNSGFFELIKTHSFLFPLLGLFLNLEGVI